MLTRAHARRYTNLLKTTFMLFACRVLTGEPGLLFLREDLAMVCYEHEHLLWALGLGLPAMLLWVLGFPIAKVLALYTRRNKLDDEKTHATYGFIYNGFKPGFYWWEFVADARKILMAAISVFVGNERIYVKTILVILLCLASFVLQVGLCLYLLHVWLTGGHWGTWAGWRHGCAVSIRAFFERRAQQAGRAVDAHSCDYIPAWCAHRSVWTLERLLLARNGALAALCRAAASVADGL